MKRALVSVSDKTGLVEFVQGLVDCGYESFLQVELKKLWKMQVSKQLELVK